MLLIRAVILWEDDLPQDVTNLLGQSHSARINTLVCDYIAGMTDHYAVDKFEEIFIPMGWQVRG